MVLVPGCLCNISSHKVRLNSKGWASLKKGANLKITVPVRLTRKMWTLISKKVVFGYLFSDPLYSLYRSSSARV